MMCWKRGKSYWSENLLAHGTFRGRNSLVLLQSQRIDVGKFDQAVSAVVHRKPSLLLQDKLLIPHGLPLSNCFALTCAVSLQVFR